MTKPIPPRKRRGRNHQEDFHETLAAPIANQPYRSQIDLIDTRPSTVEQIVRLVAVILSLLLLGRLITNLFTTDPNNSYVNFFNIATTWMVWPFQLVFGQPPINATGGFFDWPAIVAMIVVSLVTALIVRVIRPAP